MQDFQRIYNATKSLIESKDEDEDTQLRIESNIQALNIIKNKIENEDDKIVIESLLNSLNQNSIIIEHKQTLRNRKIGNNEHIDEEMLKNTLILKNKAQQFKNSLKVDDLALKTASKNFSKNSIENERNLNIISKTNNYPSISTIFFFVIFIFLLMYFIIRFY